MLGVAYGMWKHQPAEAVKAFVPSENCVLTWALGLAQDPLLSPADWSKIFASPRLTFGLAFLSLRLEIRFNPPLGTALGNKVASVVVLIVSSPDQWMVSEPKETNTTRDSYENTSAGSLYKNQ
jgi:hypothetical protein